MAIIQDAATGKTAEVDADNQLKTFSVSQVQEHATNIRGFYYSIYFRVTPAAANSYFFYFQNTGIFDLNITNVRISSTVPTYIFVRRVTGTPTFTASNTSTVQNRNLGSNFTPSATIRDDTNITGLTAGNVIFATSIDTANREARLDTYSNIIVPQGQAIAFQREAATGIVTATISLAREIAN